MDGQVSSGVPELFHGRGVLVVGHGTADAVGAAETRAVAAGVATLLPGVPVELGFLEVIGPSIGESLARLAARGCREVVAAPLLLFAAGHAKRDIPAAVAAAAAGLGVAVRQADAFGLDAHIVALAARRRGQAVAALPPLPGEELALVVVGRGSSDPDAGPQLQRFVAATLAGDAAPRPRRLVLGFVAAARPSVPDALAAAADPTEGSVRRIIVQPHLLFRGHVEEQVTAAVRSARAAQPAIEWVQAPRLGPDPLVSRALVRLAAAACERESTSRQG